MIGIGSHLITHPTIYSVIVLYELGTSSYCYLNVGAEEENKIADNKSVTTGLFRGKEK